MHRKKPGVNTWPHLVTYLNNPLVIPRIHLRSLHFPSDHPTAPSPACIVRCIHLGFVFWYREISICWAGIGCLTPLHSDLNRQQSSESTFSSTHSTPSTPLFLYRELQISKGCFGDIVRYFRVCCSTELLVSLDTFRQRSWYL
jgi:hypothetical protein